MNTLLTKVARRITRYLPRRHAKPEEKYSAELQFWEGWFASAGNAPETDYYRKFMMDMGDVRDAHFFDGLVCVDIGCGPKGSLTWLTNARAAIGVDPLAQEYERFGIAQHRMTYLRAHAEDIPLPSASVDVVFSMNSIDHVEDFPAVCQEIRRLLRPGGWFIGSINLDEPATETEPWTLTESLLEEHLFHGWNRQYYQVRPKLHDPAQFGPYKYFYTACPPELLAQPGPKALWCRFQVPMPSRRGPG